MIVSGIHYKSVLPGDVSRGDDAWIEKFAKLSNENGRISPYRYQIDVAKRMRSIVEGERGDPPAGPRGGTAGRHGLIVLRLPTGSGKSIAGYAATLVNGYRAVFAYPTRELVREQYEKYMSLRVDGNPPDAIPFLSGGVAKVNAEELASLLGKHRADLPRDVRDKITRSASISEIYETSHSIFTTIDSFYYASSFAYGRGHSRSYDRHRQLTSDAANVAVSAMIPDVYFIDEFDSYDVKQKASIEWMICMLCHPSLQEIEGRNKCVVIASATPDKDMIDRLVDAGITVYDDVEERWVEPGEGTVQVMPDVNVSIFGDVDRRGTMHLHKILDRLSPSMVKEFVNDGKRVVFICDSVKDCKDIVFVLVSSGIRRGNVGEISGLGAATDAERKAARGKMIVVGNHAIDIGIDFDADVLFMTAPTQQSFEQRLGRLRGKRKRECACFMLLPYRVSVALEEKFGDGRVDRKDLHDFLCGGDGGAPVYAQYNKYYGFRSSYAPVEFLMVLDDRSGGAFTGGGYSPMSVSIERKEEVKSAARAIFPVLYRRTIDDVIKQYHAMRLQFSGKPGAAEKRGFVDWIFMSFRDQPFMTCSVHDLSDGSRHDYNVETVLRHGNIIPEGCHPRDGKTPVIVINGYKLPGDRGNELHYTVPASFYKYHLKDAGFTETRLITMPTDDYPDERRVEVQCTRYPFVVDVASGVKLESSDESVQRVIESVITPALKSMASDDRRRYQYVFIGAMPSSKNPELTATSLSFWIESILRLPMHDKTSPFVMTINTKKNGTLVPTQWHGVIGIGVNAMLLKGALEGHDYWLKHRSGGTAGD